MKAFAVVCAATLLFCACSQKAAPRHTLSASQQKAVAKDLSTGVRDYNHHAYKMALAYFNRGLKINPQSTDARYDRAMAEESLGGYKHAADDLDAIVKAHPKWAPARLHLAIAQYRLHRFADAEHNFDIALRSRPKDFTLWLDDGVSAFRLKHYAAARQHFARALVLRPRSGRAHYWLGMAYSHLGKKYIVKARNELALAAHSRDPVVRAAARRQLITKKA